jgi:hypothetical protein
MQTLTRMDKVVIENYYHMKIFIKKCIGWNKHIYYQGFFFQNLKVPLCTSTITSEFSIAFYTVEKNNTTLLCTLCMLMSSCPSYNHVSFYVV